MPNNAKFVVSVEGLVEPEWYTFVTYWLPPYDTTSPGWYTVELLQAFSYSKPSINCVQFDESTVKSDAFEVCCVVQIYVPAPCLTTSLYLYLVLPVQAPLYSIP